MIKPEIIIEHSLPDRVRLRFSIAPKRHEHLTHVIEEIDGVDSFIYTTLTSGAVLKFNHQKIELLRILKAIVIELSLEYGRQPVYVRPNYIYHFTPLSVASAAGIFAASVSYVLFPMQLKANLLRWAATTLTGAAVLEHAYGELRRTGSFDFENLSIFYLINAIRQNQLIQGSAVTWLATFARHLLPSKPHEGLQFKVIEGEDHSTGKIYNDVIISGSVDVGCLEGQQSNGNSSLAYHGITLACEACKMKK